MRRLISTLDLPKEEWLRYRKKGITGTDAGAICGLNPYSSAFQIYQNKISEDIEQTDNESMRQGRDLEEYVAQRFTEETGLKIRKANAIYQNEGYPFMLADFDRLIVGSRAGLECKTVSPYSSDKWDDGNIPLHYQMQVQHYLAVSGYDCWYVAVLIFGQKFLVSKIDRDEELIKYLITIEENFWNNNVLARVMPDPDGTDSCSETISKMYFKGDRNKQVELHGYKAVLDRRMELDSLIKKLEQEKAAIDQRIKIEMQDATIAVEADYKISLSNIEQSRFDAKKFKEDDPVMYNKYCNNTASRRFMIKRAA